MPKIVEVPGVGNVEFPDSMSDDQIGQQIQGARQKSFSGFGENIISSGGRFLGDIATAVMHPIDTATGVVNLGRGMVEKVIPGEQGQEKNVDALLDLYKRRYGDFEKFKETVYTDPIGALADLSTLAGGAGGALKGVQLAGKAAQAGKVASTAGKLARTAEVVSAATDPLRLTGRTAALGGRATVGGLRKAGIPIPSVSPEAMYRGALGPPGKMSLERQREIVRAGLEAGVPISEQGLTQLSGLIDDLNQQIASTIASKPGATVDPTAVARRLDDLKADLQTQSFPEEDLRLIDRAKERFLKRHTPQPAASGLVGPTGQALPSAQPQPIPAKTAQAEKQGTYQSIQRKRQGAYGQQVGAKIEIEKAIARGYKEELARIFPEIGDMNAKESKFIGLDDAIEKAVKRGVNQQGMGLATPIVASTTSAMTGSPAAGIATGFVRELWKSPELRSRVALAINRVQSKPGWKTKAIAGAPRAAVINSRINQYLTALEEAEANIRAQQTEEDALAPAPQQMAP